MMNKKIPDKGFGRSIQKITVGTAIVAVAMMSTVLAAASTDVEDSKLVGNTVDGIDTILNRVVCVNQLTTSAVRVVLAEEVVAKTSLVRGIQLLNSDLISTTHPPIVSADINMIAADTSRDGLQLESSISIAGGTPLLSVKEDPTESPFINLNVVITAADTVMDGSQLEICTVITRADLLMMTGIYSQADITANSAVSNETGYGLEKGVDKITTRMVNDTNQAEADSVLAG